MGLDDFLTDEERLGDNYKKFTSLKKKFKDEGMPDNIAEYKALSFLTPEKLEKIKLALPSKQSTSSTGITFFFYSEEDVKLIAKYFKISSVNMQVGNAGFLIDLLKLVEKTK